MTFKPLHILGLGVGLLLSNALHAVDLRFISWGVPDENLQFAQGTKATELSVPDESFSPVYKFSGASTLTLFKLVAGDPKPVKRVACTITLPEGFTQGLVILVPSKEPRLPEDRVLPNSLGVVSANAPMAYTAMLIDDSVAARPNGTIEFRNFTEAPVTVQVEQQQFTLDPNPLAKQHVPLIPGAKRLSYRAAANVNGKWEIIGSNPLSTRGPPDRMMVILKRHRPDTPLTRGADIRTLIIADWKRPEAPPQTVAGLSQ